MQAYSCHGTGVIAAAEGALLAVIILITENLIRLLLRLVGLALNIIKANARHSRARWLHFLGFHSHD